jgi:hypothetical protein
MPALPRLAATRRAEPGVALARGSNGPQPWALTVERALPAGVASARPPRYLPEGSPRGWVTVDCVGDAAKSTKI